MYVGFGTAPKCTASSQSDIDAASTTGTASTVEFIVGAAVGVVGLFKGGRSESHASVGRTRSPRASGLRIVPTFGGVGGAWWSEAERDPRRAARERGPKAPRAASSRAEPHEPPAETSLAFQFGYVRFEHQNILS